MTFLGSLGVILLKYFQKGKARKIMVHCPQSIYFIICYYFLFPYSHYSSIKKAKAWNQHSNKMLVVCKYILAFPEELHPSCFPAAHLECHKADGQALVLCFSGECHFLHPRRNTHCVLWLPYWLNNQVINLVNLVEWVSCPLG